MHFQDENIFNILCRFVLMFAYYIYSHGRYNYQAGSGITITSLSLASFCQYLNFKFISVSSVTNATCCLTIILFVDWLIVGFFNFQWQIVYAHSGRQQVQQYTRRVWRYQQENQNMQIDGQITQWQKKIDKKTNNDLQNITHKTKDGVTRTNLLLIWSMVRLSRAVI